jgi:hypothetical protein
MAMGGVGEAMLFSAAMGGGSAALTGGDPLKGALLGGLTGGLGAGISNAMSAAQPLVDTGVKVGTNAATTAAQAGQLGNSYATLGNAAANTANAGANVAGNAPNAIANFGANPAGAGGTYSAYSTGAAPLSSSGVSPVAAFNKTFIPPGNAGQVGAGQVGAGQAGAGQVGAGQVPVTAGGKTGLDSLTGSFKDFFKTSGKGPSLYDEPYEYLKEHKMPAIGAALAGATGARKDFEEEEYNGPLKRFKYNPDFYVPAFADGGIANLAAGGYDIQVGEDPYPINMASGGISNLGGYSDGGRMLRGPGDGMSDSIPASISGKRPARLADGEFVVPADVVSHLGNGSTDAGAKQLYAMMNKVRQARTGRKAQGREINPRQYVPA